MFFSCILPVFDLFLLFRLSVLDPLVVRIGRSHDNRKSYSRPEVVLCLKKAILQVKQSSSILEELTLKVCTGFVQKIQNNVVSAKEARSIVLESLEVSQKVYNVQSMISSFWLIRNKSKELFWFHVNFAHIPERPLALMKCWSWWRLERLLLTFFHMPDFLEIWHLTCLSSQPPYSKYFRTRSILFWICT